MQLRYGINVEVGANLRGVDRGVVRGELRRFGGSTRLLYRLPRLSLPSPLSDRTTSEKERNKEEFLENSNLTIDDPYHSGAFVRTRT